MFWMISLKGLTTWMLWCTWTHVAPKPPFDLNFYELNDVPIIWHVLKTMLLSTIIIIIIIIINHNHSHHDHWWGSWWRVTCVISRWIVNDGCWLILTTRPYFHGHCYLYHHYHQCELFHIRHNHIDLIARVVCLPARLVWFWQRAFPLGRILATDSWKSKSGATTDNGDDDDD